jgi:nitric oxide reductase NorQ protein
MNNPTTPSANLDQEPFYLPVGDEVALFKAAYAQRLPVLLKGPTGCGKTRFVEYMAYQLFRGAQASAELRSIEYPLQTIACHEDLSATDLVGRFLLQGDETVWQDGPLTRAVQEGSICYLDEIVEARKDSTVLIHSLTDHRRILPIEKRGLILDAHPNFLLVISYNPGYQNVLKDLKTSTRQRFIAIDFDYPSVAAETDIIAHESGVDLAVAGQLATLGAKIRHLREHGFDEGVSTRLLIYAGQMMVAGVGPARACDVAICRAVSDDTDVQSAMQAVVQAIFAESITG